MKTLRYFFTLIMTALTIAACQENRIKPGADQPGELEDTFYGEVTDRKARRISLTWDAQPGVSVYQILRALADDEFADPETLKYSKVAETSGTVFEDKDLTPESTYFYKVQAHYGAGKVTGTYPLLAQTRALTADDIAYERFSDLGTLTGGVLLEAGSHQVVPETVIKVIRDNIGQADADIVLLIDNTGSMSNDISEIKKNLNKIIDVLPASARLGIGTFADQNYSPEKWYDFRDLTSDFATVRPFLNAIITKGGGDLPESVYDGVYETLTRASWSQKKRIIIVIGDNTPLEGKLTRHSYEDVIRKCQESGVKVNLFPILITGEG